MLISATDMTALTIKLTQFNLVADTGSRHSASH